MNKYCFLILILFVSVISILEAAEYPGQIKYSDDSVLKGDIFLGPKQKFKIHTATGVLQLDPANVSSISFQAVKQEMVEKWRFIEAGKTQKEKSGKAYPLIYLQARIQLRNSQTVSGSLYSTVIYLRSGRQKKKIILMAKLRGKEGETYTDLVFPQEIIFKAAGTRQNIISLKAPEELNKVAEWSAVKIPDLTTCSINQASPEIQLPDAGAIIAGLKTEQLIIVGWPESSSAKLDQQIRKMIPEVKEFFDKIILHGAFLSQDQRLAFSLMMLSREGKTTLHKANSQPWRLEIWKWNYDAENGNLLLAGKAYLSRGIDPRKTTTPKIQLNPDYFFLNKSVD